MNNTGSVAACKQAATEPVLFMLAKVPTVTLASTNNALPDDGVTAPKHVGAVFIPILM